LQVEDTFENDENIEELMAGTQDHQLSADAYNINFENPIGNQLADVLPQGVSSQIRCFDDLNGKKKSTKRSRKARGKSKEDKIREQKCQNDEMNLDSNIKSKDIEDQSLDNKHRASNLKKSNKKGKKVSFITSTDSQTACTVSNISGVRSNGRRMAAKNSYTSSSKQDNEIQCSQKIVGKSQVRRSGKQRLDVVHEPPEDLTSVQNQCEELAGSASSTLGLQMDNNRKDANTGKRKSSLSRNSMPCSKERKSTKKPKISPEFISRTKNEEIKSKESIKIGTDARPLNDSSKEKQCHLTDQPVLRKCVNHVKDYQCAFCLSSEESEVKLFAYLSCHHYKWTGTYFI
jgi:BRCA1-associated RING domain protein 1